MSKCENSGGMILDGRGLEIKSEVAGDLDPEVATAIVSIRLLALDNDEKKKGRISLKNGETVSILN